MAEKSTTSPEEGSPAIEVQETAFPKDFVDDQGNLCLRGEAYWKFRALQADCDNITSQLAYTTREIELVMNQVPGLRELLARKQALLKQSSVAAGELSNFNTCLQDLLGIDLSKCGIDDRTGRITIPETDNERPAGPASA
jgi:hypothetical protein